MIRYFSGLLMRTDSKHQEAGGSPPAIALIDDERPDAALTVAYFDTSKGMVKIAELHGVPLLNPGEDQRAHEYVFAPHAEGC